MKLTKLTIRLSNFIIVLVWGYSCSHCGSKWSLRDRSYFVEERSTSAYAKQSELMCCTQFCTVTHQKTSQSYCKLSILLASCKLSTSCNKLVAICSLPTFYNLLKQLAASLWITSFDNQLVCMNCYIYYSQSGEVSLHAAVHCGHVGVVKALLNKGASVDTKTKVRF